MGGKAPDAATPRDAVFRFEVIGSAQVHLSAAIRTEQQAGEHTHVAHLSGTAAALSDFLDDQKHAFLNNRFLCVLKDHPIRRIIPQYFLALERLLGGFEVDRMAQIVKAFQNMHYRLSTCHTVNFKTSKQSFKSKKVLWNDPADWVIFENTQEPIIEESVFLIVQKIRQGRRRPTKMGDMGMFSGLLFCADCGGKMYLCRANHFKPEHASAASLRIGFRPIVQYSPAASP